MKKLYSLFIAIDTYHPDSKVPPLEGCRNDVTAIKEFIKTTYAKSFDLSPEVTLFNADATYQNICKYLGPEHLAKAGKDDVVLVYYSGHGTQEKAAPEFEFLDPTGLQESMVCYDSGLPGKYCLSDKELRILLSNIQQQGAHLSVIFDCCHSGTITRGLDDVNHGSVRQFFFPEGTPARPYTSYLDGYFAKNFPKGPTSDQLPLANHMLLTACNREEKAYELKNKRGMFSFNLLKVLSNDPDVSYADLYTRCQASMFRGVEKQHPQFEAIGGFDPWQTFLNNGTDTRKGQQNFLLSANERNEWTINCGAIHGLSIELNKVALFDILDQQSEKKLGQASSSSVGFQDSIVTLQNNLKLDMERSYTAQLLSIPAAAFPIALKATPKGKTRYESYLKSLAAQGKAQLSPFFECIEGKVGGKYRIDLDVDLMEIYNQENNTLIKRIGGDDDEKVFDLAVEILERIARWEKSLALDNRNTLFNRNAFGITVKNTDSGKVLSTGVLDPTNPNTEVISVQVNKNLNGQYILPIDLELKNSTSATLFYKALYFSRAFEVLSLNGDFLTVDEIPTQDQFYQPNALEFELPDGKTERIEIVKFIVSTTRINEEFLLEQEALEKLGETVEFWKERGRGVDLLAGGRDLRRPNQDKKAPPANDWFCKTLVFKLSPATNEIGKNAVPIGNGKIVIKGHDTFKANVALSAAGNATRDLNSAAPLPQIFGWENLLALDTASRDLTVATPDTLEIISPENEDSLRNNPLQIELDVQLQEGEYILPLTFDGEDFIPIGEARPGSNGKVEISIHSFPEEATKTRSLVRAIKMCFFKVALGAENQNKLCWIEYTGEKPIYHDTGVKEKVANATNILLVVHGIVGNTSEMTAAMEQAQKNKLVDLVLAYDYENLNSTIESNAGKLKDALANVGIKPDKKGKFNKKFSILAHSMGGLVSRYYIEHLAGNEVVAKLILAGTPSGGSNLAVVAKYRDTALFLLPFALNLGLAIPGLATILGILNGSKKLTVSLEQMDYNNSGRFLKNLEQSKDPKIPYYVLAGHLDEFLKINEEAKRLVNKIFKGVANAFFDEANDIAVSVKSIKNVPSKRKPAPVFYDTNCHHLNYFLLKESVDKILEILKK